MVKRLLKGIFNARPPKPKYECIWDANKLLTFLKSIQNDQDFKMLSIKTAALLTILPGQRVSSVHKFKLSELQQTSQIALFNIPDLVKHSRPRFPAKPICYRAYPHDKSLCPIALIKSYLLAREHILAKQNQKCDKFFIVIENHTGKQQKIRSVVGSKQLLAWQGLIQNNFPLIAIVLHRHPKH